jgi:hypothetical protein
MSTLKIEERITVAAPPSRVWTFLLDPAKVAPCLPGARLDGTEGDATFLGTMKVKVGPVLMELKGKATLSEVVEAERRVTMTGTGNDKSGGGSAKMVMTSRVLDAPGGGSEIVVEADVDLAGKLVRFGRGMMEGISKQLFKQFAERVQAELAQEKDEAPKAEEPKAEEPKAEEPKVEEPKAEEPKVEEPKAEEPKKEEPKEEKPAAPIVKALAAPAVKEPEALDAGSLAWSALWAWIVSFFRRLFGRRS